MKLSSFILALLVTLARGSSLRAEIALQGVACTLPQAHFALIDSISGAREWIAIGGVFLGFTARAYDPISETLILGKDDDTIRLGLSRSSPQPAPAAPAKLPAPVSANNLERDYWLATTRDERAGGFMLRLRGAIETRLAIAREVDAAEAAFARDYSPANAQRLSDAKRKLGTDTPPEMFLWTRAVEPATTR